MIQIEKTKLAWKVTLPFQHTDKRGTIYQTFHEGSFQSFGDWFVREQGGFDGWRQENIIVENFGALRGLHCHSKAWLLMTCLRGHVVIGLLDPKTNETERFEFRFGVDHTDQKYTYQILVPPGIANGHCSLWAGSVFHYFWSVAYENEVQKTYKWNEYNIDWGIQQPILSERDK